LILSKTSSLVSANDLLKELTLIREEIRMVKLNYNHLKKRVDKRKNKYEKDLKNNDKIIGSSSMFDEDKVQPCEDCGKKYIRENLIEERSRVANYKLFCIRCYNRRKNENMS